MEKEIIILPPLMFGSTAYYATAAAASDTVVDWNMKADKRFKASHRYDIASTRGPIALTVPVGHLSGGRGWNEVEISTHGQWWHVHRVTLETAYGRTPFFEFYIDRLLPLLRSPEEGGPKTVGEFCQRADALIRPILDLPSPLPITAAHSLHLEQPAAHCFEGPVARDYRHGGYNELQLAPYWQVRQAEFGFLPGLSILDLIFNTGPEAALHIRRTQG